MCVLQNGGNDEHLSSVVNIVLKSNKWTKHRYASKKLRYEEGGGEVKVMMQNIYTFVHDGLQMTSPIMAVCGVFQGVVKRWSEKERMNKLDTNAPKRCDE